MPDPQDYETEIVIRDEIVTAVGNMGTFAYYDAADDAVTVRRGDISLRDFGVDATWESEDMINIIHERQHQINHHNGVNPANYKELQQDEYKAHLAGGVTLFRMLRNAPDEESYNKIIKNVSSDAQMSALLQDLQNTGIDIKTTDPKELNTLMGTIKDSTYNYLFDGNFYNDNWQKIVAKQIVDTKGQVDLSEGLPKGKNNSDLNIGGFDFSKVGRQNLDFPSNPHIEFADKMLKSGADYNKVANYLNETADDVSGFSIEKAESLDLNGLSRDQAMQVLQTAIVVDETKDIIAESVSFGDKADPNYNFIAGSLREKTATYLDLKLEALEKNGVLSEKGDEKKFAEQMHKAKQVEVDAKGWLKRDAPWLTIAKDPSKSEEFEKLKQNVEKVHGTTVNYDDLCNPEKVVLPLDGTNIKEVLGLKAEKEAEARKIQQEYQAKHPETTKRNYSEPYKVKVPDYTSDILQSEFGYCLPTAEKQASPYKTCKLGEQTYYIIKDEKEVAAIEKTLTENGLTVNVENNNNKHIYDNFRKTTFDGKETRSEYYVPENWIADYNKIMLKQKLLEDNDKFVQQSSQIDNIAKNTQEKSAENTTQQSAMIQQTPNNNTAKQENKISNVAIMQRLRQRM